MKERLLANWSITRAFYLVIGIFVMVQGFKSHEWYGVLFGGYFAAMGLFAFGCASGHCGIDPNAKNSKSTQNEVDFEEVK